MTKRARQSQKVREPRGRARAGPGRVRGPDPPPGFVTASDVAVSILRADADRTARREDRVAVEEPLEVRIDGRPLCVTMRTPGHDEELAAGLLLAEGVVRAPRDIGSIAVCRNPHAVEFRNVVDVFLAPGIEPDWPRLRRTLLASSSCGLCGKATLESLRTRAEPLAPDGFRVSPSALKRLPARLRRRQRGFEVTGGLHAAALFAPDGTLAYLREDVGRHNAVDKVLGAAVIARDHPRPGRILMVSGRASYEIVQKAVIARVALVAAVSAPSSLAVDLAEGFGITLVGFLRGDSYNVYTHPARILSG